MVHTRPPWTTKWRMATIFGQIDQGELVTRLGSIDTFDRRGNILFIDGFEGSMLKWEGLTRGEGASVSLNNTYARNGDISVKCVSGDANNDYAGIRKYLSFPVKSKTGFEISFTHNVNVKYYEITMIFYDGTVSYSAIVRLDVDGTQIRVWYGTGAWKDITTTLPLEEIGRLFHTIKLVADLTTGYFSRLILDNVTYDLSGLQLVSGAPDVDPYLYCQFWFKNTGVSTRTVYLDDAIVTINEE